MITDKAIAELAPLIGVRAACRAVGRPQANHYRRHRQSPARLGCRASAGRSHGR
jgi:hypothetical protein